MASITPTPVNGSFEVSLFDFLSGSTIENFEPYVYTDSVGIPTLGVGYALLEKNSAGLWVPINLTVLEQNVTLTTIQISTLTSYLQQAADAKNGVAGAVNPFPVYNPNHPLTASDNILDWAMTTTQAQSLFNAILPTYLTRVQTWLRASSGSGLAL